MAALTPEPWEIALIDENWESFSYQDADLVGITAFTASAHRAYEIAKLYRKREVPVVVGGIHASMCTDEALRFADTVVVGEAEKVWPQVLADFEGAGCNASIEGSLSIWSMRLSRDASSFIAITCSLPSRHHAVARWTVNSVQ